MVVTMNERAVHLDGETNTVSENRRDEMRQIVGDARSEGVEVERFLVAHTVGEAKGELLGREDSRAVSRGGRGGPVIRRGRIRRGYREYRAYDDRKQQLPLPVRAVIRHLTPPGPGHVTNIRHRVEVEMWKP